MGELRTFLSVSTSSRRSCTSREPLLTFARSRSRASTSCATFSRSICFGSCLLTRCFDLGTFQGAQPLRRFALDRGRAEFEARRRLFLLALRNAFSAPGRGDFPPDRGAHLSERGWTGAVLEAFEPAVELGGGEMKSAGQSRRLEARGDFFHLADPAPRLARLHGDDLGALRQLGLRALPFLQQRRFDPFVRRESADRGEQRGGALGPGRVAGLERGGRTRGTFERNRFEVAAREQARDVPGASARQIDARARARDRRGADDAAVDERRLRGFEDAADVAHRAGRNRVRVDIDAAEAVAGNLAGERKRAVRRTHRQHDVGHVERALERAEIFEPRCSGARACRRAAAGRRPDDPQAASAEAGADCGAHLARMQQRDSFHCEGLAARESVSRRDDLNMMAAHVDKGRVDDLAVAAVLPDLGLGHRDEVLRLHHVVGHPRAGHQLDVALDAILSGQDGDLGLVGIRHSLAPGWKGRAASMGIVVHARPAETGRYNPAPETRAVKTYQHHVAVHWGDTDPARIVFYPNYFEWFDQSTRLFFDSVGLDWDSLGQKYGIAGLPIVEAKARFLAPCRFRDEIVIESRVGKWNDKTFEVGHVVLNRGVRAVEGYEIRVWAHRHPEDANRLKAMPIPAEIKAAFE